MQHMPRTTIQRTARGLMPRLVRTTLSAVLLSSTAGMAGAQEADADCPFDLGEETLGETADCGKIMVPQDWSEPEGTMIPIQYLVLRSPSLAPLPDPVIYFQGGPGGATISSRGTISGSTDALRASRDIIMFDQRGTGFSNELYCPIDVFALNPATYEEDDAAASARLDEAGIGAFSDPDEVYAAVLDSFSAEDLSRCLPFFAEQGIALEHYSTASTVRDTIAVMEHLGYPSYNLFGGSYGTTVVLAILGHYTEMDDADLPPIRAAVLDSVDPPNMEFYERGQEYGHVVLGLFDDCAQDAACAAAYPDIRTRMAQLFETLRAAPIVREEGEPVTMEALAEVMRTAVASQKGLVPYLPRLVDELERGETAVFDLAMAVTRFEVTLPQATQNAGPAPEAPSNPLAAAQTEIDALEAQLDAVRDSVSFSLGTNAFLREAAIEADGRADLIATLFELYTRASGKFAGQFMEAINPYVLHPEQRNVEGLKALIGEVVILPALATEMQQIADRLHADEVREVFAVLTSSGFDRGLTSIQSITNRVVNCNDRGPTISNEVAFEAYAEFEVPALIGLWAQWPANYQISCEQLGLAADAYAPPPPPVESDVRTLVVTGSLDIPTPARFGYLAAETLSNSTVVELPMAGHVPGLFDLCGRALVHSFILSPEAEPNTACIEAARVSFVMPDGDLPQ
jgi:pimeloyl-ACP methyl ester carboxylesterase